MGYKAAAPLTPLSTEGHTVTNIRMGLQDVNFGFWPKKHTLNQANFFLGLGHLGKISGFSD
jgi:hypothetical protein